MRWRRPTRPLILIALLLLAGAVVNVAVAWGIAATSRIHRDPFWMERLGMAPNARVDQVVVDLIVDGWNMRANGIGRVSGDVPARWPSQTPSGWPDDCMKIWWRSWGTTWTFAYQSNAPQLGLVHDAESGAIFDYTQGGSLVWRRSPFSDDEFFSIESYRVGWPTRALELEYSRHGNLSDPYGGSMSSHRGFAVPSFLLDHGLFEGPQKRIPTHPLPAGFAINTLFYAAILALPLSVFPIRRRLRARRGRCPKCGYDLAGLVGAEKGAEGASPCPECGATR